MSFFAARALLWLSRISLAYLWLGLIFILGFVTMALGLWQPLFWWLHLALLVLWGYGLTWAWQRRKPWPSFPSSYEARRALEHQRDLLHRPLTTQVDRPAFALSQAQAQFWQRTLQWANRFQPRLLLPVLRHPHDRWALRYAAACGLVIAFSWGHTAWFWASLAPLHKLPWTGALQTQAEVLVNPPVYANLPAQRWQNNTPLKTLAFSEVTVKVPAAEPGWLTPKLYLPEQTLPLTWHEGYYTLTTPLRASGELAVFLGWWPVFNAPLEVIPDAPPSVALVPPIKVNPQGVMNLSYAATDDHGVQSIVWRVTPPAKWGEPFDVPLHIPQQGATEVNASDTIDLTLNPLAGFDVAVTLVVTDVAGQSWSTPPMPMTLPEREFFHPVAQQLAATRRGLWLGDPASQALIRLEPLMSAPQAFGEDKRAYLSMAMARASLYEQASDYRPRSMGFLWDAAVRVEDGPIKAVIQDVLRAQENLTRALAQGADPATVAALYAELQQRMLELLSRVQFGNEAVPEGLTNNDLANLMKEIESLLQAGATAQAQELLQQLKKILANVQTGGDPAAMQALLQNVQGLAELAQDQQQLIDQAFQGAPAKDLARDQQKLAKRAQKLHQELKQLGLDIPAIGQAADLMQAAGAALTQDRAQGQELQTQAYQALQQGQQQLGQQLRQMLGYSAIPGLQRDPTGRPVGLEGTINMPENNPASLSRQIRDLLYEGAADTQRPVEEKSYFRRLLERF